MPGSSDDECPRFLTDEDFNMDITAGLRHHHPDIDLLTVQEAGLLHAPDPVILQGSRRMGRILLSHDTRTMPGHFYEMLSRLAGDEHHPGVMLVPQESAIGEAIEWIAEIWEASAHEEWRDVVTRLPL